MSRNFILYHIHCPPGFHPVGGGHCECEKRAEVLICDPNKEFVLLRVSAPSTYIHTHRHVFTHTISYIELYLSLHALLPSPSFLPPSLPPSLPLSSFPLFLYTHYIILTGGAMGCSSKLESLPDDLPMSCKLLQLYRKSKGKIHRRMCPCLQKLFPFM